MKKYNNFETTYSKARQWIVRIKSGEKLQDQKKLDKNTVDFRRLVYLQFKHETARVFDADSDFNTFLFDQNELKVNSNGRESLKSLCFGHFIESEALYLANNLHLINKAKKKESSTTTCKFANN